MQSYVGKLIKTLFLERPVKGRSLASLKSDLERSGKSLLARLTSASDTAANRSRLQHIIGLERWGVARLKHAPELQAGQLNSRDAVFQDKHHAYKPAEDIPWEGLIQAFQETREATLSAIESLAEGSESVASTNVWHNQHGQLSVAAWLRYLRLHADLEAKRIR